MDWEQIVDFIDDFGYAGLFIYLWIGVFAVPLPNEFIIFSLAIASSQGYLNPLASFVTAFLGIITALTTSYILGRFVGIPIIFFLLKKRRFKRVFIKSKRLLNKYQSYSLFISYFIPGIRLLLPFLAGLYKIPYKKFSILSYSGVFIWLVLSYLPGYLLGDKFTYVIVHYEHIFLITITSIIVVYFVCKRFIIKKDFSASISKDLHKKDLCKKR